MKKSDKRTVSSETKKSQSTFKNVDPSDLDEDLFKRNLEMIRRHYSALANQIEAISEPVSRLVVNDQNQYDIRLEETYFYGKGHEDWAAERLDGFEDKEGTSRLNMNPVESRNLDDETNEAAVRLMKSAVDAGIEFQTETVGIKTYHTIVLGIGLGSHLIDLVHKIKCRNLVLVEPNIELLYWSCYVMDWTDFEAKMEECRCAFTFVIAQISEEIVIECRNAVRTANPAFIEGLIFFQSYHGTLLSSATKLMIEQRAQFNVGLGFIEDEIDMVRNSYRNLKSFDGYMYSANPQSVVLPSTFVVGGGPSLDNDMEFIKKNQSNAIIIACGTTIRALLKNGIVPDFQMEMENNPLTPGLMENLTVDYDLSQVRLVATSTIDPNVKQYFKETIFYIRGSLSSTTIFALNDNCFVYNGVPTVTNLGFSFAQEIGCRNIYLFGVDLGARDPKKHHSSDAPYNEGELDFTGVIDLPAPANFGGIVQTERIYDWGRINMENCIVRYQHRQYVNCSDGLLINGMLPKLSSGVEVPSIDNKAEVIDAILAKFSPYGEAEFAKSWNGDALRGSFTAFYNSLVEICEKEPEDVSEDFPAHNLEFLFEIVEELVLEESLAKAEHYFLRGSSLMFMTMVFYYYARVKTPEEEKLFAGFIRDEYLRLIKEIRDLVIGLYDYLEADDLYDERFEYRIHDE